jgi:hypothetical protein
MNNIPHQVPCEISRELTDHLERLQLELPETNISFSTILPKIGAKFNHGINYINTVMDEVCYDLGVGYIQHSAFCERGQLTKKLFSPSEWKEDRPVHPSHEGVKVMMMNIRLELAPRQSSEQLPEAAAISVTLI